MTFTVQLTVEVDAHHPQFAVEVIRHALNHAKKAEIRVEEIRIIAEREDEP